uniref:F-box protein 6 n=2 Tax=Laurasiatheria TaxID=314145 RepID=A0A8C0RN19_CANLF
MREVDGRKRLRAFCIPGHRRSPQPRPSGPPGSGEAGTRPRILLCPPPPTGPGSLALCRPGRTGDRALRGGQCAAPASGPPGSPCPVSAAGGPSRAGRARRAGGRYLVHRPRPSLRRAAWRGGAERCGLRGRPSPAAAASPGAARVSVGPRGPRLLKARARAPAPPRLWPRAGPPRSRERRPQPSPRAPRRTREAGRGRDSGLLTGRGVRSGSSLQGRRGGRRGAASLGRAGGAGRAARRREGRDRGSSTRPPQVIFLRPGGGRGAGAGPGRGRGGGGGEAGPGGGGWAHAPAPQAEARSAPRRSRTAQPRPSAEGFEFWSLDVNGGDEWKVEDLSGDQRKEFPNDQVKKYFVTSYYTCLKSQVVDLKAEGYWEELMDTTRPDIEVKDWFAARPDCGSKYQLCVQLLSSAHAPLGTFQPDPATIQQKSDAKWREVSHTFSNYPPGVRYIWFQHGGVDTHYWAGWYGPRVTNSSITIGPPLP